MLRWLPSFKKKSKRRSGSQVLELLVLEGEDAGQQFTVDGTEIAIGHGTPRAGQPGAILLSDPTVSLHQAVIRLTKDGAIIEDHGEVTNPTLVNNRKGHRQSIAPGDRIRMGGVVLEVRARTGIALSGLHRVPLKLPGTKHPSLQGTQARLTGPEATASEVSVENQVAPTSAPSPHEANTEHRPIPPSYGYLTLLGGVDEWDERVFYLQPHKTTMGRSTDCDIHIPELGVSRRHAELIFEGQELTLIHLSQVNPTFVNGVIVSDRQTLSDGDEIRLADRVVLRLRLDLPTTPRSMTSAQASPEIRRSSLWERMEEKIRRDRELEEDFAVTGSFLDIDVVGSYEMKEQSMRPEHHVVSFERFRSLVAKVVKEFDGQVLNCNGDELMCFFDSTLKAVRSASEILKRLDAFNESDNLLKLPFRLRAGVHTGTSLVDRTCGVAYSPVLDIAGHLQKHAKVNGLLISEDTLRALPEGLPFEPAGKLEREGIITYQLIRWIE